MPETLRMELIRSGTGSVSLQLAEPPDAVSSLLIIL